MEWKDFILQHEEDDLTRLVLSRDRYPEVDVALAATTIECRRRLCLKVPQWYAHPELVFPLSLSAEQCSSAATARYKARLAASLLQPSASAPTPTPTPTPTQSSASAPSSSSAPSSLPATASARSSSSGPSDPSPDCSSVYSGMGGPSFPPSPHRKGRLADLTGGLGVDSWAFSEFFEEVLYNEMVPVLAEAAKRNFAALCAGNIHVCCYRICATSSSGKPSFSGTMPLTSDSADSDTVTLPDLLGDFHPDVIFLDPARRGMGGRKVFLLEDCSPDVTNLLPDLLAAAPHVLLKLSPMADITMLLGRLSHIREIHVVASGGECKELLVLLERGFAGEAAIIAAEIPEREERLGDTLAYARYDNDGNWYGDVSFRFKRAEEAAAVPMFGMPSAGDLLFEPGKSLSKAGCFNLISDRFGLRKIGRNTHLYFEVCPSVQSHARLGAKKAEIAPNPTSACMNGRSNALQDSPTLPGKWFRVLEVLPLDKRGIAEAGAKYPAADVSARGVPLSSEDLATRLKKAGKGRSGGGKIPEQVRNDAQGDRKGVPSVHLWGVRCDAGGQNLLLVTERE